MAYASCSLYVLSGTGNTAAVGRALAQSAESQGIAACAIPINRAPDYPFPPAGPRQLVGLLTPTHGFITPWGMLRFALRLPAGQGRHALCLATRAGSKLGRLFLPGLEGTAAYLPALILALKGYKIRGVRGLDMPSNWVTFHPGYTERCARAIVERNLPRARAWFEAILDGRLMLRSLIPLLLGLLLLPISAGYLLFGRFFLAKVLFANERCDGCALCEQNCPFQAIRMQGGRTPRPYWTFSCESCMRCVSICPQRAIEGGQSWGVMLWYATTVPVGVWALQALGSIWPRLAALARSPLHWLIGYPYYLLSLYLMYRLANLLSRWRPLNALLTYTTLTRLPCWRRYHEPDTRLHQLNRAQAQDREHG